MGLGEAKWCGGFSNVIILREEGERGWQRGEDTKRRPVFMGAVDTDLHQEECSHYVILLF